MTNLLDTKQNLTKEIDSNELYQSLNKKNVLQQLTKIRIDHSITISESDLKIKMQMVYEACQHLTNKQFIDNCINLAKTDLFGKFPPAYKFAQVKLFSPFEQNKSFYLQNRNKIHPNLNEINAIIQNIDNNQYKTKIIAYNSKTALFVSNNVNIRLDLEEKLEKLFDIIAVIDYKTKEVYES